MTEKPKTMEEAYNPEGTRRKQWAAFVESTVADFFTNYELEKLSIEDGNGNKAKLSRAKEGIKVEHSSTTIL